MPDVNAQMMVIRKNLSEEEGQPAGTRYNEECDCVETSVDGGETWTENDGSDPRKNPAYLMPPNSEEDVKCAAAGGMVAYIRSIVDAGIAGTTITGLANVLLGLGLLFLPISWFFLLFVAIADALIAIGGAALTFSFTESVYDDLQCIFYCLLDEDGRISEEGLAEALVKANDQFLDATINAVLALAAQMVGAIGFSNSGSALADPEADCSACLCAWCYYFDFTIDQQGWTIYSGVGSYDAGIGFKSHDYTGENALLIQHGMSRTTSIRRIVAYYTGTDDNFCGAGYYDGSFHAFGAAQFQEGSLTPTQAVVLPTTTTGDVDNLYINEDGLNSSLYTLIGLWVCGDFSPNPFGDDNCDCPPE